MPGSAGKCPGWRIATLLCYWSCEAGTFIFHLKRKYTVTVNTKWTNLFKQFREKWRVLFKPTSGQRPGRHNLHKKGVLQGRIIWGRFIYLFCVVLHTELHIIMRKNIPESYRLFLMFSVCASQYDLNLMGTREVLLFFLSLCLQWHFLVIFFFSKQMYNMCLGMNTWPMLWGFTQLLWAW